MGNTRKEGGICDERVIAELVPDHHVGFDVPQHFRELQEKTERPPAPIRALYHVAQLGVARVQRTSLHALENNDVRECAQLTDEVEDAQLRAGDDQLAEYVHNPQRSGGGRPRSFGW
jgi:hypothetical protein